MKRIILAVTVAASTFAGAASAEQYVCEMGQSTGFALVQGEWVQVRFEDNSRYLINTDTMTVSQFGREGTFLKVMTAFYSGVMLPSSCDAYPIRAYSQ
ncbi:hypothetical protein [Roseobacter sp. HKCCD7870]|uniref:hypothetical protein n=1 Tax=Roseobacter sp. HKCCD7870 TaxID=3120343 RepID=UPI0030EF0E41